MAHTNYQALDPADLSPLPDVPDQYGPRDADEVQILQLVLEGLASGPGIPLEEVLSELESVVRPTH